MQGLGNRRQGEDRQRYAYSPSCGALGGPGRASNRGAVRAAKSTCEGNAGSRGLGHVDSKEGARPHHTNGGE